MAQHGSYPLLFRTHFSLIGTSQRSLSAACISAHRVGPDKPLDVCLLLEQLSMSHYCQFLVYIMIYLVGCSSKRVQIVLGGVWGE